MIKSIKILNPIEITKYHRSGCRSALRVMRKWIELRPDITVENIVDLIKELELGMDSEDQKHGESSRHG